jgi:hypothetical protein
MKAQQSPHYDFWVRKGAALILAELDAEQEQIYKLFPELRPRTLRRRKNQAHKTAPCPRPDRRKPSKRKPAIKRAAPKRSVPAKTVRAEVATNKVSQAILKPHTSWLQVIWGMLLHPDGPSLNQAVLLKRTGLRESVLPGALIEALKRFRRVLQGELDPEPEFTEAFRLRWPSHTLPEILAEMGPDKPGCFSIALLQQEIAIESRKKSPTA